MSEETFSLKKVAILAGAIIALVIGSGFATGQEIMQYFTAYGMQSLLVVLVFAVTFIYYNFNFAKVGAEQKYERSNDVYKYFCGKYIGSFFDYYSTLFCYMSFFVMIGGASSTLTQGFGIPEWVGGVILTVLVVVIVSAGLQKLVDIIGVIGPIKIAFFIAVGVIVCVQDWSNISAGLETIATGAYEGAAEGEGLVTAGSNWLVSGLSYAGFVLLWFASFTTALGAQNGRKNLNWGIIVATFIMCFAICAITFAQISNINTGAGDGSTYVWNAPIPNLILAGQIWAPLSIVFAVVVFIGICATAVPLLYNPVSRFAKEGSTRFRILAVVLGIVGLVVGLFFPYRVLVNVIYVLNGYVGAVLLLFMLYTNVRDLIRKRKGVEAVKMEQAQQLPAEENEEQEPSK